MNSPKINCILEDVYVIFDDYLLYAFMNPLNHLLKASDVIPLL